MELIDYKLSDVLKIYLKGKIDSTNANMVEEEILTVVKEAGNDQVVLDASDLLYISSAGLRVVLRLKRLYPALKIINVSNEVYDIFDMTGFTEFVEIQKAYRVISVEGCEVIGQGANGKVYRIDPDTIIKVYMNPDSLHEIHRERELARTAFVSGIPTAIPYDVVRVEGGGYGSVFELLNATSFAKLLIHGEKSVDEIADMSVALLKTIHATPVDEGIMPNMKEVALDWVSFIKSYLDGQDADKLESLVQAIPDISNMMHGDYHIKNIMLQDGESLLIDMDTLCTGHPVFEFGAIYNAYCGFSELDHENVERFLGITLETSRRLWRRILELYFDTTDEAVLNDIENKARIVGYIRLIRRVIRHKDDPNREEAYAHYTKSMHALLQKVDTLAF